MRISLISFYLRNSLFCRSQASSYNVQQFRNLAAGNTATTVEENEEEPWVDPYNKALPEKSKNFFLIMRVIKNFSRHFNRL